MFLESEIPDLLFFLLLCCLAALGASWLFLRLRRAYARHPQIWMQRQLELQAMQRTKQLEIDELERLLTL